MEETTQARRRIDAGIQEIGANIRQFRTSLNQEGVWLFLTVLGCWSVTFVPLQFTALGITLLLFLWRLHGKRVEKRAFAEVFKAFEARIEAELPLSDARKACLYDLRELRDVELSTRRVLAVAWPFLLSWGFYGATLVHLLPSRSA